MTDVSTTGTPAARAPETAAPVPGAPTPPADGATAEEFWDARYRASERIWSGRPNPVLVREADGLTPGRALDLGCGEGADAVWLARRGWRVTAVDISRTALERGAEHAGSAGVADRIDWQWHDLAVSFPAGEFDLVSAQFLHSEVPLPRERILRTAAAAVAPGGALLIVGHAGPHPGEHTDGHPEGHAGGHAGGHAQGDADGHAGPHPHQGVPLPTPEEVVAALDLPPHAWELLLSEEHAHGPTTPDGRPGTRTDNTVLLRRLDGAPAR
ncbi:class I SAM-dependent methyltransferase [Kitasatospora sp. NPDC057015]|uniref:class I SAM-dependent methyltransferase n=1 Tax=Kitasatospora sp. NPDC057015 TaxID=3346001 RepID=UPI00363CE502